MSKEVLYTDETKLKDLTVGQLKDLIIETLNSRTFIKCDPMERRTYQYKSAYEVQSPYEDPNTHIYCGIDDIDVID